MKGWRYEWVEELPQDVFEFLVDVLKREAEKHDTEVEMD